MRTCYYINDDSCKMEIRGAGSTQRQCTTTFGGRTSYVQINPTNFGKQKWKTKNVDNVFQAYSNLYARNVRPRCSVDLPHTTSDAEFCSKETTHSQVFGNYANLCATNPNHTGASVLDQRKRTRQSSQVRPPTDEAVVSVGVGDTTEPIREVITSDMAEVKSEDPNHTSASILDQRKRTRQSSQARPPTDEAGTSKGVRRPPPMGKITSAGRSNRLPPVVTFVNTESCSSGHSAVQVIYNFNLLNVSDIKWENTYLFYMLNHIEISCCESGVYPESWILAITEYFLLLNTPADQWLKIVGFNLEGAIAEWFQWMMRNGLITTWARFEESVRNCFGPSEYEDPNGALSKLLQLRMVKDYQREFEKLMNRATDISDSLLISFYIFGLKLHLQREFLVSRPTTLGDAFSLALITEACLDDHAAPDGIT
ncbi:retrotransposon-related protein [Tanacetum coccineum]